MKKVAFHTIGCKLNQFETEFMRELFEEAGWEVVSFSDTADVYVINTCTVTAKADSKARQSIRQAKRRNPSSLVVAVGCYPQVYLEDVKRTGADVVLGNKEKVEIVDIVEKTMSNGSDMVKVSPLDREFCPMSINRFFGHSRAFVKVQDGCDKRCSYCVVWKARGPSRSAPLDFIVNEVKRLASKGYEEVVLTGTNLGDYGKREGVSLIRLLEELSKIDSLKKIRLSSIEPLDLSYELLKFISENEKICRHLHVPVQSASDRILELMGRNYRKKDLFTVFERIFSLIENVGVGIDVIVGFPTESHEDFMQTYRFIEEFPIYYMHIFSFSPRPNTLAYELKPKVRPDIIKKRWESLNELKALKKRAFVSKFVDKIISGVVESRAFNENYWSAISDNYIQLLVEDPLPHLAGKVLNFKVKEAIEDKLLVYALC